MKTSFHKILTATALVLAAVLLLAFFISCCRWCFEPADGFALKLLVTGIVGVLTLPLAIMVLFFWRGKKYLLLSDGAVEIHLELLSCKRIRRVQLGRNSRLVLRQTTHVDHGDDDGGACYEMLELHLTDAYGRSCRLQQYTLSERERAEAIAREICHHLPALKLEQE